MNTRVSLLALLGVVTAMGAGEAPSAQALSMDPLFAGSYTIHSLGSLPEVPSLYGGLTFLDSNTILVGGAANSADGRLYQVDVTRGVGNHITGFSGAVSRFGGDGSIIGAYNDGGIAFGPGGVLFLARWPVNEIGQVKPGATAAESKVAAGPFNADSSISALNFVPFGFSGAGSLKLVSYDVGQWYDAELHPDGAGTFDVGPFSQVDVDPSVDGMQNIPGGPEGFVYIAAGNPLFSVNSMLISEYNDDTVGAYEVDAQGNPLINTRRTFVSDLVGVEGAAIDPLTGDFLFSTFGGGDQVVVVQGFKAPPSPNVPGPLPIFGSVAALGYSRRLRKRIQKKPQPLLNE